MKQNIFDTRIPLWYIFAIIFAAIPMWWLLDWFVGDWQIMVEIRTFSVSLTIALTFLINTMWYWRDK